jgi:hypothetical protein
LNVVNNISNVVKNISNVVKISQMLLKNIPRRDQEFQNIAAG